MFDQFTVEEIIELGESGGNPLDGMTSEQMSDLTNAVVDCMSV
jgi:hypothetical protein